MAEEGAQTAATAPVSQVTSAPGKAIVDTVVDLATAGIALQELDNLRNQIAAKVAAAALAGDTPAAAARSGTTTVALAADDREIKRLRAEGKDGEVLAKAGPGGTEAGVELSQTESGDSALG